MRSVHPLLSTSRAAQFRLHAQAVLVICTAAILLGVVTNPVNAQPARGGGEPPESGAEALAAWNADAGEAARAVRPQAKARAAAASARAIVTLRPRADLSSDAWDARRDTYDRDYVYPATRPLRLDGCASRVDGVPVADSPLPGPSWTLEPLDRQHDGRIEVRPRVGVCAKTVALPALGRWRITLTVRDAAGSSASATKEMTFRDVLVAAIGDSFASGEGNKLKGWADEQCHRSSVAWPAELARRLENASTAVTFLSFACSGAEISHLITRPYKGQVSKGQQILKPQLRVLRSLLGSPLRFDTRPVDVLLGSAGINDLGVGAILEDCAIGGGRCRRDLSRKLAGLPDSYNSLELALSDNIRLGQAYFAGYPARIFTNATDDFDTCGVFGTATIGDAEWITDQAVGLNKAFSQAADRHRWSFVGTTDLFRRHGYCADVSPRGMTGATWFRSWVSSVNRQGDNKGTAHPNLQGHRTTAAEVRRFVRTDVAAPPTDRFVVRFLRLHMTDNRKIPWPGTATVGVGPGGSSSCGREREDLTELKLGQSNDLSANPCLRFVVQTAGRTIEASASTILNGPEDPEDIPQDEQQPPGQRRRTEGRRAFEVARLHARANGWDATSPVAPQPRVQRLVDAHDDGRFELEYEITTEPVVAPPQ